MLAQQCLSQWLDNRRKHAALVLLGQTAMIPPLIKSTSVGSTSLLLLPPVTTPSSPIVHVLACRTRLASQAVSCQSQRGSASRGGSQHVDRQSGSGPVTRCKRHRYRRRTDHAVLLCANGAKLVGFPPPPLLFPSLELRIC